MDSLNSIDPIDLYSSSSPDEDLEFFPIVGVADKTDGLGPEIILGPQLTPENTTLEQLTQYKNENRLAARNPKTGALYGSFPTDRINQVGDREINPSRVRFQDAAGRKLNIRVTSVRSLDQKQMARIFNVFAQRITLLQQEKKVSSERARSIKHRSWSRAYTPENRENRVKRAERRQNLEKVGSPQTKGATPKKTEMEHRIEKGVMNYNRQAKLTKSRVIEKGERLFKITQEAQQRGPRVPSQQNSGGEVVSTVQSASQTSNGVEQVDVSGVSNNSGMPNRKFRVLHTRGKKTDFQTGMLNRNKNINGNGKADSNFGQNAA